MIEEATRFEPVSTDADCPAFRFSRTAVLDLPRNPHGTPYVDWIIAVVDGLHPEPSEAPLASLKKTG